MAVRDLMRRTGAKLRSERGIAMPSVLMVMIAGLALGGAAVTSSIGAQQTSSRDQAAKEALAAADAGVQQALYRQNKVVLSESLPCVGLALDESLIAKAAAADGWCEPFTGQVGDATFTYRVQPATLGGALGNERRTTVVAVGSTDEVGRRVAVTAKAKTGAAIFSEADLVGLDQLDLTGASQVTGDVGSNGNVTQDSTKSLCGDVTYGYGKVFDQSGPWCSGYSAGEGEIDMAPPLQGSVPPSAGGVNSNARIYCGLAGATSGNCDTKTGNVSWNPTTRVLSMSGGATLTLGGSQPYSLCRLDMQGNSQLIAAHGATVKIYFDTPENCAADHGASPCPSEYTQVDVRGSAKIVATSSDPKDLSLLFVGSTACPTRAVMSGNSRSVNEAVFYGPLTHMELHGNGTFSGAMAGKTTTTGGSATFLADPDITDFDVEIALQYKRERYVECVGATMPVPPSSNC